MGKIPTVTYVIWFLSEVLLSRLMLSSKNDKKNADKNSLALIWVVIIFGVFFRLIIIKSLGKFFTVDVTIRGNHQLKTDGFYKYLRNLSYFAS